MQRNAGGNGRRRGRGEDGSIMILALVMVVAFGLVAVAAGQYATTNMKDTIVTRDKVARSQAAASAARIALNQLQVDPTLCGTTSTGATNVPIAGVAAKATCMTTSGTSAGVDGFVLAAGVITSVGIVNVQGPLMVRGANALGADVKVNGDLWACSATPTAQAPYATHTGGCDLTVPTDARTSPVPPTLPTKPTPTNATGAAAYQFVSGSTTCSVFTPGTYTVAPVLGTGTNYFLSGTYYLAGIGALDLSTRGSVVAGAPGTNEKTVLANGNPCVQGTTAMGAEGGTGALFILGGNSTLTTTVAATDVELYARRGSTASAIDGLSIITVPASGAPTGYAAWTGGTALAGAASSDLVVHGEIWAYTGAVSLGVVPANSRIQAYGGVAAITINLLAAGTAALDPGLGNRTVTVASTSTGGTGAVATVTATASVGTGPDPAVAITSWTTT